MVRLQAMIVSCLLICLLNFASCIVLPTPTKTVAASQKTASSAPKDSPTTFLLSKRDTQDDQNNLDLYQNWASMCRQGVSKKMVVTPSDNSSDSLSINQLWTTVTSTINCGGGNAVTITTTINPTATATPSSTSQSCTGQCWSDYLWHTYGDSVSPAQGFAGIVCVLIGLYFQILGFRFFRSTMGLTGFVFFATMTWIGLVNNEPAGGYPLGDLIYICVSAGLGLLGAFFLVFFYPIGIYCLACLGGFYFSVYILSWKTDLVITIKVARICFMIGISLLGPVILYFVETYMVLLTTALMGSYLFYFGLDFFAHTGFINPWLAIFDGNPYHHNTYIMSTPVFVMLAFVIVSTLLSFGWQYYYCIMKLKIPRFGADKKEVEEEVKEPPAYVCMPPPPPPYCNPQPMFVQNTASPYHHGC